MAVTTDAKLVWYRLGESFKMVVKVEEESYQRYAAKGMFTARVADLKVPILKKTGKTPIYYSQGITLKEEAESVYTDDIFAILTGVKGQRFAGNKSDYRDLANTAKQTGKFIYVLPVTSVTDDDVWTGYVRVGRRRWIAVPCPRPTAIYNRISLRNLERAPVAVAARRKIEELKIPMFNPEYFDKAEIYRVVSRSAASSYLPETYLSLNQSAFREMLTRHSSIYLKPRGGSIGQGMVKIDTKAGGYDIAVLKDRETKVYQASSLEEAWNSVNLHRMPGGQYLIQAAKPLLKWQGRPCDFRTLLQKYNGQWRVVGIGVRVAGEGVITTHVPNGGSIVAAKDVLEQSFGPHAGDVEHELRRAVLQAADAIDTFYDQKLGEMSMDMAIEDRGRVWFLEANSKPMKFDEKIIRKQSLEGVILHLEELQHEQAATARLGSRV